ncbi:MAG: FmdB family transcriptional regulator [Acidobacteriota bacterium]|nr:FmdB family transcriptional regulator [Acidobacteriota bacterium]
MPTYEYACTSCGEHLEVVQSFRDESLTECPACGGPLRKVFGSIGIVFKGSGFYKTDSRPGDAKKAGADKATATADASKSSSDSGTSSKESTSGSKESGTGSTAPTSPTGSPSRTTPSPTPSTTKAAAAS